MEKLSDFFINKNDIDESEELPPLTKEELDEILESLGIPEEELSKDTIYKTFRSVKEFKIARTDQEKEKAEDNDEYEDYGTVRIKTKSGSDALATLRLKKNDKYGTIIIHGASDDDVSNVYDTMRIVETPHSDKDDSNNEYNILWRAPEEWEVNIIALERGEWNENMQNDAFRKYKKERPKLGNLFDNINLNNNEKLTSTKSEEQLKVDNKEEISLSPKLSSPELSSSSESSSKKKKSKKSDKSKVKESPKPTTKKERRWAIFKRQVEQKRKEQMQLYE